MINSKGLFTPAMYQLPVELCFEIVELVTNRQALACTSKIWRSICFRRTKIPRTKLDYLQSCADGNFLAIIRRRKVKRTWTTESIYAACLNKHLNMLSWLLKKENRVNVDRLMQMYCWKNSIDHILLLIDAGACYSKDELLISACEYKNFQVIEMLLGADVNFGIPLHDAFHYNQPDIIEFIFSRKESKARADLLKQCHAKVTLDTPYKLIYRNRHDKTIGRCIFRKSLYHISNELILDSYYGEETSNNEDVSACHIL